MAFAAICRYFVARPARLCHIMIAVAINANGSIPVPGRQGTEMIAVLYLAKLLLVTGLTLLAAF
jgi:hypothetical protein